MTKRAAIYLRVSTPGQADHGGSIEAQTDDCRDYAASLGLEVAREYGHGDRSGRSLDTRPSFQLMLDEAEQDIWDVVIVTALDRFGRDMLDAYHAMRLLRENGKVLHVVKAGLVIDFQDPDQLSSMKANYDLMQSEGEGRTYTDRGKAGHQTRVLNARWNGGPPPYGFMYGADPDRLGKTILVQDPSEAPAARVIWEMLIGNHPTHDISKRITSLGYRTRRVKKKGVWTGGTAFSQATVFSMARNPVYAGCIHAYDPSEERTKVSANGKRTRPKRLEGVLGARGQWEPFVTADDWHRVQTLVQARRNGNGTRGGRPSSFLLTNTNRPPNSPFLRCECGHALTSRTDNGTYWCTSRKYGDTCGFQPIHRDDLEGMVRDFICDGDMCDYNAAVRRSLKEQRGELEAIMSRVRTTQSEIDQLEIDLAAIAAEPDTPQLRRFATLKFVALDEKKSLLPDLEVEADELRQRIPEAESIEALVEGLRQQFRNPAHSDVESLRLYLRSAFRSLFVSQIDGNRRYRVHFFPLQTYNFETREVIRPVYEPHGETQMYRSVHSRRRPVRTLERDRRPRCEH